MVGSWWLVVITTNHQPLTSTRYLIRRVVVGFANRAASIATFGRISFDDHRDLIARRGLHHVEWPLDAADVAVIRVVVLGRDRADERVVPALQPHEQSGVIEVEVDRLLSGIGAPKNLHRLVVDEPFVISHFANDCRSRVGASATIASSRAPSRLPFVSGIADGSAALMLTSHAFWPS